jgi:hypothetical protein
MVLKYYIDFVVQKYIKEVFKFQKVYRLYKAYPLFPLHQFYSYLYVISKQTLLLYEWLLFTFFISNNDDFKRFSCGAVFALVLEMLQYKSICSLDFSHRRVARRTPAEPPHSYTVAPLRLVPHMYKSKGMNE